MIGPWLGPARRVCGVVGALIAAQIAALLAGCATKPPSTPTTSPAATAPANADWGQVIGRGERLLIYVPKEDDSFAAIATRFLGDAREDWQIAEANETLSTPRAGEPLVVPLQPRNPLGVRSDGVQTVTVLCYHRLAASPSRMAITAAAFEAQLQWLASAGYRVVTLADLAAFLQGARALPRQSVVITFDDGYESVYRQAYPLLKRYGMPATLFIYSDFIGSRSALTWPQMREMQASGLIDIQSHSKSHLDLTERLAGEGEAAYRARIEREFKVPRGYIERSLGEPGHAVRYFAYPYGAANETVLRLLPATGHELGLTVDPGGNPFYASPVMLKRIMVFGDQSLEDFKARQLGRRSGGR